MTMEQLQEVVKTIVTDTGLGKSQEDLAKKLDEIAEGVALNAKEANTEKARNGINQTRLLKAEIEVARKMRQEGLTGSKNENVVKYITEHYAKEDPAFVREVTDRAKDLLAAGNGGSLIIEEYAQGFLDQLWDTTVMAELGVNFIPSTSGNLTYSKIVEGVSAGYVPETGMIDTSTVKFGSFRLSVKKLMALVPVSNDLLRMANISVDALIRDQLIKEMAQAIDHAFLFGKGGQFEPRGLANIEGAPVVKDGAVVAAEFNLGLDMLAMLRKKNMDVKDAAWVMGVDTYVALQKEVQTSVGRAQLDELLAGTWHRLPVVVTNKIENIDDKEDLFLVKKDAILAIQNLDVQLDTSDTASFMTQDGMVSAFHADYTLTRAIANNDFGLSYKDALVKAVIDLS